MAGLSSLQCSVLTEPLTVLEQQTAVEYLAQLEPQWRYDNKLQTISHSWSFKNFYQTMAFVNVIAQVAHQQDHHPEVLLSYNRCTVTYRTHSVGGLTIKDFICAAKINAARHL